MERSVVVNFSTWRWTSWSARVWKILTKKLRWEQFLNHYSYEFQMRKMLINLHTDACLSWRKAKPILYKKGIEHGERCMLHFEELKEIFLRDEDEDQKRFNEFLKSFYSRLTRTRRNLMELYSRDIFNSFDDARRFDLSLLTFYLIPVKNVRILPRWPTRRGPSV